MIEIVESNVNRIKSYGTVENYLKLLISQVRKGGRDLRSSRSIISLNN